MAFQPIKSYRIATSTSHATQAIDLTLLGQVNGNLYQAAIKVKTADIVLKLGSSASVQADATITSNVYITGNTPYIAGTVEFIQLPSSITHISVEAISGTGTVDFVIGYGERT
jgi:hypothetical protein